MTLLYVLDMANDKFKWHLVVVQGQGPGPRYGHAMDLVAQRYLHTVSGNDGKRVLSDAWALDTAQKSYAWQKLNPEGDKPSARMYTTASARSDGMLLLCGGRDSSATPLADAYGLLMHRNGQWEWTLSLGVSPSPRYQHSAVFVGERLHVTGGAIRGGRAVEGEGAIAGVWLDRNGLVTSRGNKGQTDSHLALESMCQCRHATASVGVRIYIFMGLKFEVCPLPDSSLLLSLDFLGPPLFQLNVSSIISQPDRVTEFCKRNKLQLIIRAHECVMDGFERFAQGQLITLFSATNYCGTANNAGAILVVDRGLVIVPKLIHPLPPPIQSPETSPDRVREETWMQELNIQKPPSPTRGRPQPNHDRSSLAYK